MSDLKRILSEREALYAKADIQVDTAGRTCRRQPRYADSGSEGYAGPRVIGANGHFPLNGDRSMSIAPTVRTTW